MKTNDFIAHLRQLIANDDLPTALQQLKAFFEESPKLNEVLLQSARYASIKEQIRLGSVQFEQANVEKNQIRHGLLELLSELEAKENLPEFQEEMQAAVNIVNSKNVVNNSNIQAGGDVHIGDKNTTQNADKIYNIDKIDNANFS